MRTIEEITGIAISPYRHLESWLQYKYYIDIDGVVMGGRICKLLSIGGTVLRQESGYIEYPSKLLSPGKHYVSVNY